MKYPKRDNTHIIESESFAALSSILPKEWIIRELTERDYGVDVYIEIVGKDGKVSGDLTALQIKGTKNMKFRKKGTYTFSGIKRTTLNYWLGLPVPVFLIVFCQKSKNIYWTSVENNHREGRFKGKSTTVSLKFLDEADFSKKGLVLFMLTYFREKRWAEIENAIEKVLMSYNTLGPLVLMCKRENDNKFCSTTIQYLLIQHYEYYTLLSRYLLYNKPKYLPYWYDRHLEHIKSNKLPSSLTFSFKVIKEMINDFVWDYRDCIIVAYELVTNTQKNYFLGKFPYLCGHLQTKPHTFVMEDWAARYFFDEYENETQDPKKLFFEDFSEFDFMLKDLSKT